MDISATSTALTQLKADAERFFSSVTYVFRTENVSLWTAEAFFSPAGEGNDYWSNLTDEHQKVSVSLQKGLLSIVTAIISVMRASPLLDQADERDVGACTKKAIAALKLREYRAWETEVLHDEGTVLGVVPARQSDNDPSAPPEARQTFIKCAEKFEGMLALLSATPVFIPDGSHQQNPNLTRSYRPNTAFIMMPINPDKPYLEDVYEAYKYCFDQFDINATRADDIQHEGMVASRIIEEIKISSGRLD